MKKVLSCSKYLFLFLFFFVSLVVFFNIQRGDTYVNFGFSYAISRGEIPYLDFNLVIPPLAPYLYSIFLFFSKSILVFYLEQALLLTILFYFLFTMYGKKTWLYLILLCISFPISMSSCCFLTKQTVGGLLLLASIYYLFVDYKKFFVRILGFCIPVICALILFFIQGNLVQFFDLCFLGLFDFGHDNFSYESFYVILFVISMIFLLIRIIKKPKDIKNYYVLLFSSCVYPIIDYYHVSLFLAIFLLLLLEDIHIKRDIALHCIIFSLALSFIWLGVEKLSIHHMIFVNYTNFPYSIVSYSYDEKFQKLENYVKTLDSSVVFFLRGSENYFYKIKNNLDITYFDLPNYGNYGYDGIHKMMKMIQQEKGSYFVIDREAYQSKSSAQQYMKEAVRYIINHGRLVKKFDFYEIYYLEGE